MDYNEILAVLIAICPTVSLFITMIGSVLALVKTIKAIRAESDEKIEKSLQAVRDQQKQLSKLYAKVSSIEKCMVEERDKR